MTHQYRSHNCGQLGKENVGEQVRLSGWVHRIRDHGGLLFIDLRDHYGLTQCVVEPDEAEFSKAENIHAEWVVRIDGPVVARDDAAVNKDLATGAIEVRIAKLEVLSKSEELPLPIFGEPDYPEDIRLKYRFSRSAPRHHSRQYCQALENHFFHAQSYGAAGLHGISDAHSDGFFS